MQSPSADEDQQPHHRAAEGRRHRASEQLDRCGGRKRYYKGENAPEREHRYSLQSVSPHASRALGKRGPRAHSLKNDERKNKQPTGELPHEHDRKQQDKHRDDRADHEEDRRSRVKIVIDVMLAQQQPVGRSNSRDERDRKNKDAREQD